MDDAADVNNNDVYDTPSIPMEDFLEHFGVKGMRWGVRNSRRSQRTPSITKYSKKPSELSDQELGSRIKRMEMERRYLDLNSSTRRTGRKFAEKSADEFRQKAVVGLSGAIVAGVGALFIAKMKSNI